MVKTAIGTTVVETAKRVYNPVTEEYREMEALSEDGYCRKFLAVLYQMGKPSTMDVEDAPVLTFDTDIWELEEAEGHYRLTKKEAEGHFEEMMLEGDA